MAKDKLSKIRNGVIKFLKSGMIFTNRKTDFCVELNLCPLMKKTNNNGKVVVTSPLCKSCYSTDLINISYSLRNKILNIPTEKNHLVDIFEEDIKTMIKISSLTELGEIKRIRFYGLTDFAPDNIPFILTAAKYLTVDVISKTLTLPHNEEHLKKLINIPNVWISLSFNSKFLNTLSRTKKLLEETNANNVQLNYCLHTKEENPMDNFYDQFQVIHLRDKNKWNLVNKGISETRVCGLYNRNGSNLKDKETAHCKNCTNCHISYLQATKK